MLTREMLEELETCFQVGHCRSGLTVLSLVPCFSSLSFSLFLFPFTL
uniref:Uncharacterized protein n=1 Tax=Angiostrongylus cantonensis TaxID=6313 RepID=A0A0K0DMU2_ANGCA